VLDRLLQAQKRVVAIGKIDDLFASRGISRAVHTACNRDGMRSTLAEVVRNDADFVFTNLVDFDTMWGHRNDARAYALGLEDFDSFLSELLPVLGAEDLLIVTSDHGNDPTTRSTDHSREEVPLLVYHASLDRGRPFGTRESFADVGATVAENFGVVSDAGASFLSRI
jgi:phosphopentomutase